MKRMVFISALLLTCCAVQAQKEIYFGARGGLNIPKLTASGDNPMSKGYSSRLAGNGGIFAEFRFTDMFSIQPMIEYTQQGGKRDGMQAIPTAMMPKKLSELIPAEYHPYIVAAGAGDVLTADLLYADFKSETKFDYLMIPVLAKFGWKLNNSPIRLYVDAGPFVSFLLGAKQVTKGNSFLYLEGNRKLSEVFAPFIAAAESMGIDAGSLQQLQGMLSSQSMSADRNIKDNVYKVNYGVSANIGLSYEIAPRHNLLFEVGGNYGFRKMQKSSANGQNRIGAGTVIVGYAYRLK